ncbi:MAG: elongation factor P [bacterium]
MYSLSDLRKNLKIQIDGEPYLVVDAQFVKPGKGNVFTRTRLKNLINGSVLDRTYKSQDKIEPAYLEEQAMQFLYAQGETYHFMNTTTYEQVELDEKHVGEAKGYLIENMEVGILFFKNIAISINLPNFVELQIVETDPTFKGNTVTAGSKPAILHTGAKTLVPMFLNNEDWIVVDTRTGEYVERVKK